LRGGPKWREAALELATFERRAGARERAAELWQAAWRADPGCPEASEAWAKHLEHQLGDLGQALAVARGSRLPCERRIARLEARLAREADVRASEAPRVTANTELRTQSAPRAAPREPASRPSQTGPELLTRVDQTEGGAVVRYRLLR
jgi:hypothetical protein